LGYNISFKESVEKDLRKIGSKDAKRIIDKIEDSLAVDPSTAGTPLTGDFKGLWRMRVGDYRIIYTFSENTLEILILRISHRKDAYNKK